MHNRIKLTSRAVALCYMANYLLRKWTLGRGRVCEATLVGLRCVPRTDAVVPGACLRDCVDAAQGH